MNISVSLSKKEASEDSADEDVGVDYESLRPTYTHEALKILLDKVPTMQVAAFVINVSVLRLQISNFCLCALRFYRLQGFIKYVISQNGDGLHKLSGIPSVSPHYLFFSMIICVT
jgi:hypothetical protein